MGPLASHICSNEFYWLEDGIHNSGEMEFNNVDNGQYMRHAGSWGNWNVVDEKKRILWLWKYYKTYEYQFNEELTEAVMIKPVGAEKISKIVMIDHYVDPDLKEEKS